MKHFVLSITSAILLILVTSNPLSLTVGADPAPSAPFVWKRPNITAHDPMLLVPCKP